MVVVVGRWCFVPVLVFIGVSVLLLFRCFWWLVVVLLASR